MPGPKPSAINLIDVERQELELLVRRYTTGQQKVIRARIVLLAAMGNGQMMKLLMRASLASINDLKAKVLAFVEYFNKTMAKPFKWTYQGRALAA